jgi:DNA-binding IclR family transcriptional regulator
VDCQGFPRTRLFDQFNENVNLAVLDGADVVYVEIVEGSQRVKLAAFRGQQLPTFCTASGKATLAFLPEESAAKVLDTGISFTHKIHTHLKTGHY